MLSTAKHLLHDTSFSETYNMQKVLNLTSIAFSQYFVYRLSFTLWRVRNVMNILMLFFLWTALVPTGTQFAGYQPQEIMTYVLLVNVIGAIILSTKTPELSDDILSGNLSNYVIKPFSIWGFVGIKEITDKAMNIGFSVVETVLLLILFRPPVFLQQDFVTWLCFFIAIMIGMILVFIISTILSTIAFWSDDVWGPRFLYYILTTTFSGMMFPLDILPQSLYQFLLATPLPYMVFLPLTIYIQGFTSQTILSLSIGLMWCMFFGMILIKLWNKGMHEFSFYGK